MFSANENIMLRQHKKKIVEYVESTIPEAVLELGVNVMAMQLSCKMPGCVPLETSIVIIFPKIGGVANGVAGGGDELMVGLPESAGGCYKTKVLKPMNEVTKDDVLEALPPAFTGGQRSMERLCLRTRDVMLGQITQLFGDDDDLAGRKLMAEYLQQSLQDYIDRDCRPPEWGEAFAAAPVVEQDNEQVPASSPLNEETEEGTKATEDASSSSQSSSLVHAIAKQGNIVMQRPLDDDDNDTVETDQQQREKKKNDDKTSAATNMGSSTMLLASSSPSLSRSSHLNSPPLPSSRPASAVVAASSSSSSVNSITQLRYQQRAERRLMMDSGGSSSSSSLLAQLARQHAPSIRRPGCPCCEPDNPDHITNDTFMRL
jgi:hypothetical protein